MNSRFSKLIKRINNFSSDEFEFELKYNNGRIETHYASSEDEILNSINDEMHEYKINNEDQYPVSIISIKVNGKVDNNIKNRINSKLK